MLLIICFKRRFFAILRTERKIFQCLCDERDLRRASTPLKAISNHVANECYGFRIARPSGWKAGINVAVNAGSQALK